MLYIKNKKKYFLGLALIFFFNASAFSIETKDIALSIINFSPRIEGLAASEHKQNTPSTYSLIETRFNNELKNLEDFLVEANYSVPNLNAFIQEFIVVINNLKERITTDFEINGYIRKDIMWGIQPSNYYDKTLRVPFKDILYKIFLFIDEGKTFSDDEYPTFARALETSKLLESEKESLFKTLQKIKSKTSSS